MQDKDQNREIALRAAIDVALRNENNDADKIVKDAATFYAFLIAA